MSENDSYTTLEGILNKWCLRVRVWFNKEKTEIILIGSPEFREALINRTRHSMLAQTIPRTAKIVQDGKAVQLLGAWIGNNTNPEGPWSTILMTVQNKLNIWVWRHPTLYGCKLAISLEAGARTQFLTKAQMMPKTTEKKLIKVIMGFMWNANAHPQVSREMLHKKIEDGGLNLLCITTQNEATDVMWLKEYLKVGQSQLRWAYLADTLIARAVAASSKNVD